MQKVYIVLKNNKQEGPYSLSELQQMALKPTDLIWVEGRSAAWSYPSEIKELRSLFPDTGLNPEAIPELSVSKPATNASTKSNKKIFVLLPGGDQKKSEEKEAAPVPNIEEKAESLRQKILAHQSHVQPATDATIETRLKRSMDDVAGDFATWAIKHKAEKKKFRLYKPNLFVTAVILLIVFSTAYLLFPKSESKNLISEVEEQPIQEEKLETTETDPSILHETSAPVSNKEESTVKRISSNTPVSATNNQKDENKKIVLDEELQPEPAVTKSNDPIINEEKEESIVKKEQEKKKTVGEAINGFFDKFKNKNKEDQNNTETGDERKSKKRDESSEAAPQVMDVSGQVKVTTNAPRENWMLGIKGQKITLQNNSNAMIHSAYVTVEYYSEDETLLDTKKIEFKNIKPAQKISQPLPDHRLASYATQHVTMATGTLKAAD